MKLSSCLPVILACCSLSAVRAQDRYAAYEHCRFSDKLTLVEDTRLAEGVQGRTVKTVMGPKRVPLAGGRTLVFSYAATEPFATVKVEQVPSAGYMQARQDLIANFEQILTADDTSTRNYALKPRLNGLEIYGLDRKELDGAVLGIYLFFADRSHVATTVYFLNQDPAARKFSTLKEYAALRESFLTAYTGCIAGHPAPAPASALRADSGASGSSGAGTGTGAPEGADPLPEAPRAQSTLSNTPPAPHEGTPTGTTANPASTKAAVTRGARLPVTSSKARSERTAKAAAGTHARRPVSANGSRAGSKALPKKSKK